MKMETYESKVKYIFHSIWDNVNIVDFDTPVCDMLLEIKGVDLKFLVEVKSANTFNDNIWRDYSNILGEATFRQGAPNIPVVLAVYNETAQTISMGLALSWRHHAPVVVDHVDLKVLTKESSEEILNEIAIADKTIRMLPNTYCRVVKKIKFNLKYDKIDIPASVVYLRDLSTTYRMNCRTPQNLQEEISRYIFGIPQDEYPNDELDDAILAAIKTKYKNAEPESSLMLFNTELRDLRAKLENMEHFDAYIMFTETLPSGQIQGVSLECDAYIEFRMGNKEPEVNYQKSVGLNKLASLNTIHALLNTYHRTESIMF